MSNYWKLHKIPQKCIFVPMQWILHIPENFDPIGQNICSYVGMHIFYLIYREIPKLYKCTCNLPLWWWVKWFLCIETLMREKTVILKSSTLLNSHRGRYFHSYPVQLYYYVLPMKEINTQVLMRYWFWLTDFHFPELSLKPTIEISSPALKLSSEWNKREREIYDTACTIYSFWR